jgi:hypothetical protein
VSAVVLHTHTYELRGHVERCTDAGCLAWRLPAREGQEQGPPVLPRRLSAAERRARQRWSRDERSHQGAERG